MRKSLLTGHCNWIVNCNEIFRESEREREKERENEFIIIVSRKCR